MKQIRTQTVNLKYDITIKFDIKLYLIDQILYQILFLIYHKKYEKSSDNLSIEIYINKIDRKMKLKIKSEDYFELSKQKTNKVT